MFHRLRGESVLDKKTREFKQRILAKAKRSLGSEEVYVNIPPCTRYRDEDIELYVKEDMPEVDMRTFEAHYPDCMACYSRLARARKDFERVEKRLARSGKRLAEQRDEAQNTYLLKRTMDILDNLSTCKKPK